METPSGSRTAVPCHPRTLFGNRSPSWGTPQVGVKRNTALRRLRCDHMDTADTATDRAAESRARAARTKRDRTRAALLSAADPAFAARGWARTRVEDIASAAGVSNATAYNHFPTKHVLIGLSH